jgi:hypothetical protein
MPPARGIVTKTAPKVRTGKSPTVLAILRNLVITVLCLTGHARSAGTSRPPIKPGLSGRLTPCTREMSSRTRTLAASGLFTDCLQTPWTERAEGFGDRAGLAVGAQPTYRHDSPR